VEWDAESQFISPNVVALNRASTFGTLIKSSLQKIFQFFSFNQKQLGVLTVFLGWLPGLQFQMVASVQVMVRTKGWSCCKHPTWEKFWKENLPVVIVTWDQVLYQYLEILVLYTAPRLEWEKFLVTQVINSHVHECSSHVSSVSSFHFRFKTELELLLGLVEKETMTTSTHNRISAPTSASSPETTPNSLLLELRSIWHRQICCYRLQWVCRKGPLRLLVQSLELKDKA
jgi:hypothetical protein